MIHTCPHSETSVCDTGMILDTKTPYNTMCCDLPGEPVSLFKWRSEHPPMFCFRAFPSATARACIRTFSASSVRDP
jgi:hypothetical protein